jgi:hypothetical protein
MESQDEFGIHMIYIEFESTFVRLALRFAATT